MRGCVQNPNFVYLIDSALFKRNVAGLSLGMIWLSIGLKLGSRVAEDKRGKRNTMSDRTYEAAVTVPIFMPAAITNTYETVKPGNVPTVDFVEFRNI